MKKIKVSTHDWDTKEIDVFLDGNTLHVNIGNDENSVDLTPIIPVFENKPDYQLSSGSFDPLTKSIKLIVSAEGEPNKEVTISLESLFGLIPTIQGAKGDRGDNGQDGENGADGRDGTDGKSAYQIWLELGNSGSELDFINSLKGEKGDRGDNGSDGKAGSNPNPATLVDNKTTFFKDGKIITKRPECYRLDASRLSNGINDLPIYKGYSCYTVSVPVLNPTDSFNMTLPEPMRNMIESDLFVEVVSESNLTIETIYARTLEGLVVYTRSNSVGIKTSGVAYDIVGDPPYVEGEAPPSQFTERWGSWSRLDNVEMPSSTGIDLTNLQTVSWKDGTGILVRQDGELKQLVPARNLFQEVGVAITGRKLSGLTGETYHVVVTVTNSGEATNEVTDLVITKPLLGTYRVENFTNSKSSGVTVEKLTDLTYKIKNLNSGGTAKVEFDVIPESAGSFQFGVSVNANNTLDQQSNNNQSTITLNANLPTNTAEIIGDDCPLITATMDGIPLLVRVDNNDSNGAYPFNTLEDRERYNIIVGSDLNGKSITLTNVSEVVIQASKVAYTNYETGLIDDVNAKVLLPYQGSRYEFKRKSPNADMSISNNVNYTFENNTITFNDAYKAAKIYVRKRETNKLCNWQNIVLMTTEDIEPSVTLTTTAPRYEKLITYSKELKNIGSEFKIDTFANRTNYRFNKKFDNYGGKPTKQEAMVVTVNAGESSSFTVTSSAGNVFNNLDMRGHITAKTNAQNSNILNVTVSDEVTIDDSPLVVNKYLTIKVV